MLLDIRIIILLFLAFICLVLWAIGINTPDARGKKEEKKKDEPKEQSAEKSKSKSSATPSWIWPTVKLLGGLAMAIVALYLVWMVIDNAFFGEPDEIRLSRNPHIEVLEPGERSPIFIIPHGNPAGWWESFVSDPVTCEQVHAVNERIMRDARVIQGFYVYNNTNSTLRFSAWVEWQDEDQPSIARNSC